MRCEEFYERWRRDPNWCEKCSDQVRLINNYLGLVDLYKNDYGIDQTIVGFSENASRPLLREKDQEVKQKAIELVAKELQNNNKVSAKDAQRIVKVVRLEIKKKNNKISDDVNGVNWHHGDYLNAFPDLKDVDLILTDPPYNTNFNHTDWADLEDFAYDKLKNGGYLVSYCGQVQLPDIFSAMPRRLNYYWTIACIHQTQSRIWGKQIWAGWKPIVVFTKGKPNEHAWFNDKISINDDNTKEFHDWSQPLAQAKKLIEVFCSDNGMVLDPFCGAGTIPIAAYLLERQAYGIDRDKTAIENSKIRLQEIINKNQRSQ